MQLASSRYGDAISRKQIRRNLPHHLVVVAGRYGGDYVSWMFAIDEFPSDEELEEILYDATGNVFRVRDRDDAGFGFYLAPDEEGDFWSGFFYFEGEVNLDPGMRDDGLHTWPVDAVLQANLIEQGWEIKSVERGETEWRDKLIADRAGLRLTAWNWQSGWHFKRSPSPWRSAAMIAGSVALGLLGLFIGRFAAARGLRPAAGKGRIFRGSIFVAAGLALGSLVVTVATGLATWYLLMTPLRILFGAAVVSMFASMLPVRAPRVG